ncbi:hypothetical protein [Agromyces mangrovi Wang et al. 2018]|uniref:hypothetical protein n=1 Tax=Agromyces mangrovi TaxID=1858653 RepID=UPI00257450B7|nr:hypothetical protein [Agromyces mangrovi]BDZ63730.1 hypothetical protein GCM10025877_06680 [Agromyces mangrovi]
MKKVALQRRIRARPDARRRVGVRGGTKHDKYRLNGTVIMIPRHREIGEALAAKILRDCYRALDQDGE